jgi:hypothetical protein
LNVSDTVHDSHIKESTNGIYQNIESQQLTPVVYTKILEKEQPVELKNSFQSTTDNEQEPSKISVRDLVKRFNRQ